MNNFFKVFVLSMALVIGAPVFADSLTNELANCLVDNLNGKERKNLAIWIFLSMAAHPEIKSYSNASPKDIKESDEFVGKLLTRLLTVDCSNQLKKAHSSDPLAGQKAFELVGKVAMQELMANEDVMKSLTNYVQYADLEKVNKILSKK